LINLCNNILFTGVALTLHKLWHSHCTSCGTHTAQVVALTLHKLWHSHCTSCGTHTAQVVALTLHNSHCTGVTLTLTLHKSQLHYSGPEYSGLMQWWVCSSFMTTPSSADSNITKLAIALFYCCSLLHNNNMATNLQRFTNAFCRVWLFTSDIFGRWYSDTVTADNGKAHCFILCEKKQGWICSNAYASTRLKNPL